MKNKKKQAVWLKHEYWKSKILISLSSENLLMIQTAKRKVTRNKMKEKYFKTNYFWFAIFWDKIIDSKIRRQKYCLASVAVTKYFEEKNVLNPNNEPSDYKSNKLRFHIFHSFYIFLHIMWQMEHIFFWRWKMMNTLRASGLKHKRVGLNNH